MYVIHVKIKRKNNKSWELFIQQQHHLFALSKHSSKVIITKKMLQAMHSAMSSAHARPVDIGREL